MNLPVKESQVDYNYIGLTPSSLFVCLGEGGKEKSIENLYDEIMAESKVPSVVFYGDVEGNEQVLSWLCAKLISSGCIVAIATENLVDIPTHQLMFYLRYNPMTLRGKITNCKALNAERGDCIVMKAENKDNLLKMYRALSTAEINIPLYYILRSFVDEKDQILDAKEIPFALPYIGKIY